MSSGRRVGGIIFIKVDGNQYDAKGQFTYNLGVPKREAVMGQDSHHGYKELPQEAYCEGEITDSGTLDVKALMSITGATVTIELANGKVAMFRNAYFSGDGNVQTEEGNISVRFTGESAMEIT